MQPPGGVHPVNLRRGPDLRKICAEWGHLGFSDGFRPDPFRHWPYELGAAPVLVAQEAPEIIPPGRQHPRAAEISSMTQGSDSRWARSARAAMAGADPTLPKAQAECPRTSGPGSESPATNADTASSGGS